MSRHVDVAAYLNIAYGVVMLIIAAVVLLIMLLGGSLSQEREAFAILASVGTGVFILLLIFSLPWLLGGYGMLHRREWSRILMIVLSIINLFSVPIGTALGGYTLWVLFNDEAKAEFR